MSRWPLWAVLTPGEPAWLVSRAHAALTFEEDEEDGKKPSFEVIPGRGHYHAIVGSDPLDLGAELRIAKELSLVSDETVYSIERAKDPWAVTSWRKGVLEVVEVDPEALAESLGCPLPGREESPDSSARKPLRKVVLAEGVRTQEVIRVLEEDAGEPLTSGYYRLMDTPRGLLIASGSCDIGYADMIVSGRFPDATVYAVIASPDLDMVFVTVMRGGEGVEEFAQPPDEFPNLPVVGEIKGERSPERILAALGIPQEWFVNE
jgi:hypothetical protein